jgi:hypothetical protein
MTDLAERTTGSTFVEEFRPTRTPGRTPPEHVPPVTPPPTTPWPSRARLLIAVLAVATLLGAAGTIIGFTSGDDPSATEQNLELSVATLTAERDDLAGQVTEFDTTIATITTERDDLVGQVTSLESMIDDIAAEREDLVDQVTEFTVDRNALVVEVSDLEADLATETERVTTAEAERDVLAALFPITFDASLEGVTARELAGTYDVSFDAAYCNGLATCGTALSIDELTLRETTEGYVEVVIDDMVTAGLYRVDGALYGVADSMPAVAACGTTPRVARVGVAIFAHGVTVADDGTHQVTDLGATLTIQSEAAGTCASGLAFYGTQLTPQA